MEIGKKERAKRPPILLWLLALAVVFVLGLLVGEAGGLGTAVRQWQSIDWLPQRGGALPILSIDMPFENYNALLAQRDEGLATGVFIGGEGDFLNADLSLEGESVPVRLRLQQGVASHLGEDEKWNLDVRTRQDAELRGMSRFALLDPADNQWLNEWLLVQVAQREGLLAGDYQFVRLRFNGDERGIYVLQAAPEAALLTANGRLGSIIVEFDAETVWRSVRQFEGDAAAAAANPVTNLAAGAFRFLPIDVLQEGAILENPELTAQREAAIGLLQGLQAGEMAGAAVFDREQYGRFLALVDMFGATGATQLTNLHFYYAPESQTLQPILQNGHAQTGRITPESSFFDPQLQQAYAAALAAYSEPSFLAELEAELGAAWTQLARAMSGEAAQSPPWGSLAARQALLRQSLTPVQPVLAYYQPAARPATEMLTLLLANPLNLPLEVVGLDVGAATFLEADPGWLVAGNEWIVSGEEGIVLAAQGETAALRYVRLEIPLAATQAGEIELRGDAPLALWVTTRLLGSELTQRTAVQSGSPSLFGVPAE